MTAFYLLSGAGNDFIALAEPASSPTTEEIRRWCRRGVGVGADGLLQLHRLDGTVDLRYFNADGGAARLCVNGTRCAARLADHLGWTGGSGTVRTGAGSLAFRARERDVYEVEAPRPAAPAEPRVLGAAGAAYAGWWIDVGVPHFVWLTRSIEDATFLETAHLLRNHPELAPQGANVDFAEPSEDGFRIRSFERGVEGETLACGTGALAVAAAGLAAGERQLPVRLATRGGFVLDVEGSTADGEIVSWSLAGDARLLAEGRLLF